MTYTPVFSDKIFYKAVSPRANSFYTPTFQYPTRPGAIIEHPQTTNIEKVLNGEIKVRHRPSDYLDFPEYYLSVSTVPTDCTSFRLPARLFEVKCEKPWTPDRGLLPNKRATRRIQIVREVSADLMLGDNAEHVKMLLDENFFGDVTDAADYASTFPLKNFSEESSWRLKDSLMDTNIIRATGYSALFGYLTGMCYGRLYYGSKGYIKNGGYLARAYALLAIPHYKIPSVPLLNAKRNLNNWISRNFPAWNGDSLV